MRHWILLLLAVAPGSVAAQQFDCGRDQTQMALNWCASQDWAVADAELNRLWGIVKPRADAAGWGDRLLSEQRAWLATRDARCEAERDQYQGGSIAPLIYYTCMEEMTLRRNDDFRAMR